MTDDKIPPPDDDEFAWLDLDQAELEEKLWPHEDKLRGQETTNKLWALKAIGFVVFVMIIAFALLFLGAVYAWAAHYLLPTSKHWLDDSQLSKLQSVIFSGALGAIVSGYIQRLLPRNG